MVCRPKIGARYGIKNYAVEGRDFRFVNGDDLDFRYENIEIINCFHGVSRVTKAGKPYYKAKIHINGDYIIGYYETDIQAAIAYNKAIDLLKSRSTRAVCPQLHGKCLSVSMPTCTTKIPVSPAFCLTDRNLPPCQTTMPLQHSLL